MTLKLADYYQHFLSVFGAIAALVSTVPLLSILLHDSFGKYIFPPLGGVETFAGLVAFIIVVLITFVVFYLKDANFVQSRQSRNKALAVLLAFVILSLLLYVAFYDSFICTISAGSDVTASIGFERTQLAKTTLQSLNNCDLLAQRGPYEDQVRQLWTLRSILIARSALLIAYLGCLLGSVGLTSLAVLYDAVGIAPNP